LDPKAVLIQRLSEYSGADLNLLPPPDPHFITLYIYKKDDDDDDN
jgi:hypothetical protein